jgi:hypothetical protein
MLSFRIEFCEYWNWKYRENVPQVRVHVPSVQLNKLVGKGGWRIQVLKERFPKSNLFVNRGGYVFFNDFEDTSRLLEELRNYYFCCPNVGSSFGEEEAKRALILLREMDTYSEIYRFPGDSEYQAWMRIHNLVVRRRNAEEAIPLCCDGIYFSLRKYIGVSSLPREVHVEDESHPIDISRIELGCELFVHIIELAFSHLEKDYTSMRGEFVLNFSKEKDMEDRDGEKMVDILNDDYSHVGLGASLEFDTGDEWAEELKTKTGIDLKRSRLRTWVYNSYMTLFSVESVEIQNLVADALVNYARDGSLPDETLQGEFEAINWPPPSAEEELCREYFSTFPRREDNIIRKVINDHYCHNRLLALAAFEAIFGQRFKFEHRRHTRADGIQVVMPTFHRFVRELGEALRLRNPIVAEIFEGSIGDVQTRINLVHKMLRNVKGLWSIPFRIAHESDGKLGNVPFPEEHPDWGVLKPLELIRSIAMGECMDDDHNDDEDVDDITKTMEAL